MFDDNFIANSRAVRQVVNGRLNLLKIFGKYNSRYARILITSEDVIKFSREKSYLMRIRSKKKFRQFVKKFAIYHTFQGD